ncbi:glycine/D-amino acid oxidase-like deaminating enzyme [Roseovarius halotolerans]|uniref:Gamma-glutamylputrescine oxidoreductase n=1 Tax=Roseovarius halotolerans TaxID=505353 RepID=A0A1X6YMY2_9RHOB|nr:FAD-binding oxidoreductase [Roseovarius halotolerans]RKT34251.1 glycine/D-amino acid oxidase-like deaminating enzyme [Roseovarius halotolerans]SLN25559.1 Gamma-glutamylputrescine oxidoreductase [Roseovarius halotolerans]
MSDLGTLWADSSEETFAAPTLQGEFSVDLVILGGGFTGCAAALEAAGQGAEVVLIEAETIGHGGSGRNVGLVNAGLWLPPDVVCKTLGAQAGERLNSALAAAPDRVFGLIERFGIACNPRRNGTLHLAHAPRGVAQLQERHVQQVRRAAPVTLLDAAETRARTGSDAFHGALFDTRAGTIQPLAYARGLARAAQGQGARIFENSPALSAIRHGGHWVIRTSGGKLRSKALLVATNAYHQPVGDMTIPKVPQVNFFQLATEPLGDNIARDILPGGEGCWDTAMIMSSLRRDAAGRVILGGMGDDVGVQAGWARRKLAQLYPQLADAAISHAWAGRISMTSDHLPRILRVGASGLSIFGYSGRGIAPGTVFGQSAARALLVGDESALPLDPVDAHAERLTRLKTAFFETGARMVHMISR